MKTTLTFLFLVVAWVTYAQQASDAILPNNDLQQLEQAYKDKSLTELQQLLAGWSTSLPPLNATELQQLSARHREAYAVFIAFYQPHQLGKLGGSEWGNAIYQKASFLLVQNSLKILVAGSAVRDSITDFRPVVIVPGKQCIYLTPTREKNLTDFLGNKYLPLGTGGIMSPAQASGESEKRKQFLENFIKIWHGHWGGYWQLDSYPVAYSVTFDKDMQTARVSFRMVYEGGEATLKKVNGEWNLVSGRRTWIE